MSKHIGTINKVVYAGILFISLLLIRHYFFNDDVYSDAQRHLDRGKNFESVFQHGEAEAEFSAAIALRPRFAEAYAWRCDARYGLNKSEEALEDCNRALELDSTLTIVYGDRCLVYADLGDLERAEQDCNRALIYDSNSSTAYNLMGLLQAEMGNDEAAIEHYTSAIDIDENDGVLFYNRGRAYDRLGEYGTAIGDYKIAVILAPYHFNAHTALISLLDKENRLDEALIASDNLIVNFPDEAESYVWRASIHNTMEAYEIAFPDLMYALELDESYPYTYVNLGYLYLNQGKIDDGVRAYCEFLTFVDDNYIKDEVAMYGGCSE